MLDNNKLFGGKKSWRRMFFFCRFYVGVLIFLKGDLIAQPFERLIPPKVSFQKLFITGVPYDQGL